MYCKGRFSREKYCVEFSFLFEFSLTNNVVLINGFGIKAASKIKKFFDYHNMYFSVSCYELKRAQKINIIDRFLKQNSISLRKNTYWFLVENVSDEFLILEKELEKVLIFNKPDISIKEMGLLLVNKNSADSDNVFFIDIFEISKK